MDNELYNKIFLYLKQLKIIHKKKDKNLLLESLPFNIRNMLLYEINKPLIEGLNFFKNFHNSVFILSAVTKLIPIVTNKGDIIIEQNEIINSIIFLKQGRLGVEIAVDMNNIYNEVDNYINGNFILGKKTKTNDTLKELKFKKNNAFSLMTTLNYTMDDSFIFNKGRKLSLSYKKPVSFRKKILKFMEKKFGNNLEKAKTMNEKRIRYIKLYYIRKGEQFGEIFMFLNKPSCFTVRVKSPKAELLLLKKIDAIEISSNYPNIWKRANKKSFNNLIYLKEVVSREMIKFCNANGIKYNLSYKIQKIKSFNSLPDLEKLKNKNKKSKNLNLNKEFKKFQEKNKSLIQFNKSKLTNIIKNNNNTDIINNKDFKILNSDILVKKDKKDKKDKKYKNISNKILSCQNDNKEDNNINLTPFKEDEINYEVYNGETFTQNIEKNWNINNEINIKNETPSFNLFKYAKNNNDNSNNYKKNKNLIKLIDSSRGKKNKKLYYHHKYKHDNHNKLILNNNNYNVNYNINNSFNFNQIERKTMFNPNQLVISNSISFKLKNIYENLNIISKGNYKNDFIFQKKIKALFQNKYNKGNNNNINTTYNTHINTKITKKGTRSSSFITLKNTYFKRGSKRLSIIKENDIKNEQRSLRGSAIERAKTIKFEKDDNKKNEKDENNAMLDKITQNIIDGDKNLNNPNIFYNELFANIIHNKNANISSTSVINNIQLRKTLKNKGNENKKIISKKRSVYINSSINPNLLIK